jgi:hypothetical protein
MVPRFRRGRRGRPPNPKTELPTTQQRDGQPTENPRPPQPQVLRHEGNPAPCCCRREDRPAAPSPGAQRVAWILGGAGAMLSGVAAVVPPDVLAHLWQVLFP